MSLIRIIPSMLIYDKKCIKGKQFKDHIKVGNPVTTAISFDSQKADEIFLVDIKAYNKKIQPDFDVLRMISEHISTPLTFGGNISSIDDIRNSFRNGADKIYINSSHFVPQYLLKSQLFRFLKKNLLQKDRLKVMVLLHQFQN